MAYVIGKSFTFAAAHQLAGLPADHQCARLHGHNYRVILELSAEKLDSVGFVVDFGELAAFRTYIDTTLDHRNLNDAVPSLNPTAENLARHLFAAATVHLGEHGARVRAVTVWETETSWATYCPSP